MIPEKAIKPIKKSNGRDNTEIAVGTLIAYGVFPQTQEGIQKAKDTIAANDNWLVPSELPEYYDGIDSDLMVGRDTPAVISIRQKLKEFYKLSAGTVDFEDTTATEENIAPPKIPSTHFMQGTAGRWQPEFENDIDHAVYFAGKSPLPKGVKQREILEWLKSLGLTFEQIHDHREKVLEKINETINLPGVEEEYPYVYIDAVDQDFVLNEEDDEEDLEEDLEGLDDLLNFVRSDADEPEEEIADNIEDEIVEAVDEEDEGDIGSPDDIPDELLQDDVDPELIEKLLVTINKPKKESSYTTNKKIFDSIISNFGRIQSTLDTVNRNLENQNELIKASIETQLAIGELISNQSSILSDKFDMILKQFEMKNALSEKQADDEEKNINEQRLEAQRDAAGVSDFQDLTKQPGGKKRENKIEKYLKARLTRKLYRKLPKSVRKARQKVRNLQRLPGKARGKVASKITSMLPSKGKQAIGAVSKIRGGGAGKLAGPVRYAAAGFEYAERKAEGQNEVQALSGVGGGLAGAAAGGKAGAIIGAKFGLILGPKGAAIGAIIGGLVGSIAGGVKGAEFVDKFTGANQVTGEHETGAGLTKPGTAMLHGTEAVIPRDAVDMSPLNTLGGIMLASTTQFINSAGAVAAPIAPTFKGISAQMAKEYDVPSTIAQTNVGGSLPSLGTEIRKVKEKRRQPTAEEFSGQEQELLNTQDEDSFAEKLLKMIDPDGKIQNLMKNINRGLGGDGDSSFFPSSGDPSGLADAAEALKGMSSASGPSGGANGCVWAVNKVYEKAGIKPPWGSSLYVPDAEKKMLAAGYSQVNYGDRRPGDVMVMYDRKSPPQAHIGVVLKNGNILSNSSSKAKFAWEASPEEYNRYYGGVGKMYRMPSTMAKTESNKLQPVSTSSTPSLSSSGKRSATNAAVSNSQHQVTPTTTIAQAKPQQSLSGSLVPGQRPDISLNREQHRIAKQTREAGRAAGIEGMDLERNVASAVMNITPPQIPQQNFNSQVSAPLERQRTIEKTMEIANLSYDTEEQNNNMLLINNQQPQMPSTGVNQTPMIIDMGGKSPSEILKNIMMQRLSA
jgi:hypothetical protein